jgi:hypothetical protein
MRKDKLIKKARDLGFSEEEIQGLRKEDFYEILSKRIWEREYPGEEMVRQLSPMLAARADVVIEEGYVDKENFWSGLEEGSNYIFEKKLNGVRQLAHFVKRNGVNTIIFTSRRVSDVNFRYNEATSLDHLQWDFPDELLGVVLDGEVKCPKHRVRTKGIETRDELQATVAILAMKKPLAESIQREQDCYLVFTVFDVVNSDELLARKAWLSGFFKRMRKVLPREYRLIDYVTRDKLEFFSKIINSGGEGIVAKHIKGYYEIGKRSRFMLKLKRGIEVDAFVIGWKRPKKGSSHSENNLIGSLVFGLYQKGTRRVVEVGTVPSFKLRERKKMSLVLKDGSLSLNPIYLGRVAKIQGPDISPRTGKIQMCSLDRWRDLGPEAKKREECIEDWDALIKIYHSKRD